MTKNTGHNMKFMENCHITFQKKPPINGQLTTNCNFNGKF